MIVLRIIFLRERERCERATKQAFYLSPAQPRCTLARSYPTRRVYILLSLRFLQTQEKIEGLWTDWSHERNFRRVLTEKWREQLPSNLKKQTVGSIQPQYLLLLFISSLAFIWEKDDFCNGRQHYLVPLPQQSNIPTYLSILFAYFAFSWFFFLLRSAFFFFSSFYHKNPQSVVLKINLFTPTTIYSQDKGF